MIKKAPDKQKRAGERSPLAEPSRGEMRTGRPPDPENKHAKRSATKRRLTKKAEERQTSVAATGSICSQGVRERSSQGFGGDKSGAAWQLVCALRPGPRRRFAELDGSARSQQGDRLEPASNVPWIVPAPKAE
jgi:hypothetical protein